MELKGSQTEKNLLIAFAGVQAAADCRADEGLPARHVDSRLFIHGGAIRQRLRATQSRPPSRRQHQQRRQ